ncbi:hypothetical protein EDD18DRAFT_1109370 [Armillaria luteobubalina]|uniref:Uncharacterized protein n=1 Tax=Armillaria luteobubalina TaxID=153913 RepID=A0AA39PXS6_9AGAR|nr:hypothetical protein EDD18DRAFT_1109370 [Armillaria luteobubalina]
MYENSHGPINGSNINKRLMVDQFVVQGSQITATNTLARFSRTCYYGFKRMIVVSASTLEDIESKTALSLLPNMINYIISLISIMVLLGKGHDPNGYQWLSCGDFLHGESPSEGKILATEVHEPENQKQMHEDARNTDDMACCDRGRLLSGLSHTITAASLVRILLSKRLIHTREIGEGSRREPVALRYKWRYPSRDLHSTLTDPTFEENNVLPLR